MNRMKKTLAAVVTMLMALPFVANAQTVTFEDDYFTYEKVTDSTVKIIGFSTKFSEKASTDVLHEDGKIYLTRWGAPYTEPVIDGTRLDITTIGELAFSPDNPLYDSWPEGKELCKNIVSLETTWSSLTKIEDKAFMNCENLSDISLGNMTYPHKPMSYIGKFAFAGTKLYNVYWTSDCKTIEDGCFANIPTLTGFSFGEVKKIGAGAFLNCSFEHLEFPSTLKDIGSKAFGGNSNLKGIRCNDDDPQDITADAFDGIPDDVALIVPEGTENLYKARTGWNVFGDRIQSFTMVGQTVSDEYFSYYIYEDDSEGVLGKCRITGLAPDCTATMFWGYEIYGSVSVVDPAGTRHYYSATQIDDRAFRNNTNIVWMDLSNTGISSIGSKAFSGCTQMYHLDLPNNLTTIGESAFEGCTKLTRVTIPETVTDLGKRCFAQTGLLDICSNTTMTYIAEEMFAECPDLTDVTIPTNIMEIHQGAFSESGIKSVIITAQVHNCIYDFAFADCQNLTKVIALCLDPGDIALNAFKGVAEGAVLFVPEGGYDNFNGLPGWTTYLTLRELTDQTGVVFEDGDFKYEVIYFEGASDVSNRHLLLLGVAKGKNPSEVVIPATIMYDGMDYVLWSVDNEAFQNNGNITNVDFSACEWLQDVGEYAFSGCGALKTVKLPQNLWAIYEGAFMGSAVEEINFSENLVYIYSLAFKDCKQLKNIFLSSCYDLEEVGSECFMGTSAVEEIVLPYSDNCWLFDRSFAESGAKRLHIPYCIDTDRWTDEVFKDCAQLKDVYTNIYQPKGLASVDIFAGIHPEATLWVVEGFDGLVDTYKTLDGWKDFFADIRENVYVATGISSTPITQQPTPIYDLQGRQVEHPTKGLYIVNGRKVMVK